MNRYNRHIILSEIGPEGQKKISNAKVLVIGAGGLGCPVLQYLAAAGVGTLGIIDFDTVEIHNLQRQILFGSSSLGQNKAVAARARLEDLNDSISIQAYPEALTYKNALKLFKDYDIIVDGSDNFDTRYLVNDACVITNKPLVYGAIYKFEGQVSVFNYNEGPSYRCLFPEPPKTYEVPNCDSIGVLGVLPGIIGTMQANEVLKLILNLGELLSGKLLCYHALNGNLHHLKITRNNSVIQKILDEADSFRSKSINLSCETDDIRTSIENLDFSEALQFLDVRNPNELPKIENSEVIQIPLNEIESKANTLDTSKKTLVFCQSGVRSLAAVRLLKIMGFQNCYALKENAGEIQKILKKQSYVR
ncbi:HesA/MoeB/ThiF family protein [Gaetbulibacter aestuarii]|uniref:HesA/MoeB/ThiF family protein n=1 Tax=Gaetbulibacter aestuarii TaxID=1502358 RepID=A0ABW7N207_9FLAO